MTPPVTGWSFIIWEMATLTKPFQDYSKEDFFHHVVCIDSSYDSDECCALVVVSCFWII